VEIAHGLADSVVDEHDANPLRGQAGGRAQNNRNRRPQRLTHARHRRPLRPHYQADQPPSTITFAPVTYEDASEARKTSGPSASRAWSIRPIGTRALYASRNSGGWSFQTPARVSVFTRTP